MRNRIFWGVACAAVIMLSCGEDEGPGPTPLGYWRVYAPPYAAAWTACSLNDDGTLWATLYLNPSHKAAVARCQDGAWKKWEFGGATTEALNDILIFDDGSGWACGRDGALLQFVGGEWRLTRLYDDVEYLDLGGVDADHVWANGLARPSNVPVLVYYDGADWAEGAAPDGFQSYGAFYFTTPTSAYMVGHRESGDAILRLDGFYWRVDRAFDDGFYIYDLAGTGEAVFAVGQTRKYGAVRGRVYQLAPTDRDITPGKPAPEDYYYAAAFARGPRDL